jgi:hypothetical protein
LDGRQRLASIALCVALAFVSCTLGSEKTGCHV